MTPFLLLTPLGRLDPTVSRTLREHGVTPREIVRLDDYPRVATQLYVRKTRTEERARVQQAYEDTWRRRVVDVSAELWLLDDAAFEAAWQLKPRLRLEWPAERIPFGSRELLLRSFHLPDPTDVEREWAVVSAQPRS